MKNSTQKPLFLSLAFTTLSFIASAQSIVSVPDFSSYAKSWYSAISAIFYIFAAAAVLWIIITNGDRIFGKNKDIMGVLTDSVYAFVVIIIVALLAATLSAAS